MKSAPPGLAPLFRSDRQAELLGALILEPEATYSLTALAHRLQAPLTSVKAEVDRLAATGILRESRTGNVRLISADTSHPMFASLKTILELSYGAPTILADELRDVPGVEEAFIFGSWAARRHGVPGPTPKDVDLVVIGDVTLDRLLDATDRASARLHRPVDAHRVCPTTWRSGGSAFVRQLQSGPLVALWP